MAENEKPEMPEVKMRIIWKNSSNNSIGYGILRHIWHKRIIYNDWMLLKPWEINGPLVEA